MKLLKPNWIHHEGQAIYSIDIHPDGSRLATSGLGDDNGKIIIWNMAPIVSQEAETNENIPKMLCQMEYHLGCVNTVRWSNNGQYLASGSDDKLCMIWQYAQIAAYQNNIENWKCTSTLRGHDGDVLDLAWSPKDQYLASCSIDNTIIIWNAFKFPEIITKIKGHAGFVKGISWDPVGQYLASQSDDKTLKIWRTSDWKIEKVIDEPFEKCGNTTHILRLNWSTDGQLLISSNAIKDGVPVAKVIERNSWKTKLDLVGHRKAVTIVKFYPKILKEKPNDTKNYCLFALGSRDKSLSIWLTSEQRPLAVLYDLFDSPIVDITWSKETICLLCCSMDGTVLFINFTNKEIGYPLNKDEHEIFFKLKYSYDLNSIPEKKTNNEQQEQKMINLKFIENVEVLKVQEKMKKDEEVEKVEKNSKPLTFVLSDSNSSNEAQIQVERRLPDGRRRITPICLARTIEYETPKPFDNSIAQQQQQQDIKIRSQTATEQSTILIEKRNERNEIIEISPIKSVSYTKQGSNLNSNSNDATQFNVPSIKSKQQDFPRDTTAASQQPEGSTLKTAANTSNKPPQPQLNNKNLKYDAPNASLQNKNLNNKLAPKSAGGPVCQKPTTVANNNNQKAAPTTKPMPLTIEHQINEQKADDDILSKNRRINTRIEEKSSLINLLPLKMENRKTTKIINMKTTMKPSIELEIENFVNDNLNLNLLKYLINGQLKWKFECSSEIHAVSFSVDKFVACSCKNNQLYFLNIQHGSQICSPIVLDDNLTFLKCNSNYFMCITCNGYLYVWCFDENDYLLKVLINRLACFPIFKDDQFINAILNDNGQPVVYMSNNKSYFYSFNTQCWHQIPTINNNISINSFIELNSTAAVTMGPLSMAQLREKNDFLKSIDKINNKSNIKQDFTLNNLESQINASIGLNSAKEYKFWLFTYVRYLSENLYEDKLKELCNFLLGPVYTIKWNPLIMNFKKRDLLNEILEIIGKNLNLQRLYTSYKHQLNQCVDKLTENILDDNLVNNMITN